MANFLAISEIHKLKELTATTLIKNQIKITNTSNSYINNLELHIDRKNIPILEQSIIRSRGELSFEPSITSLEVGNLAPAETAYFEYKLMTTDDTTTLSPHITLSYTPENSTLPIQKKLSELLDSN